MATAGEQARGTAGRSGGDLMASLKKSLPPQECQYTKSEVQIPMPDGIHLVADLYQPSDLAPEAKPHGLIFVLGCYDRAGFLADIHATPFAGRGYIVLFASSRGTFGSGGTFVPGMSEQADSQAIVKWMREQPWYPGHFATFGASYMGYTEFALLEDPPEDLIASVILCGPHDHANYAWYNGAYRMDRVPWYYAVTTQEDKESTLSTGNPLMKAAEAMKAVMESTPILEAFERKLDGRAPYIHQFMTTPNIDDPFWRPVRHSTALDRVKTPVLLGSGWFDMFNFQSMEQYRRLKERGGKVYFTVGPWTHGEGCGPNSMAEIFNFLDEYVVGRKKDHRPLPVKIFVTGAEEWRELPSWPPATEPRTFFLHDNKTIAAHSPNEDSVNLTFTFDPDNPTPTIGGPMPTGGGRSDDSTYGSRSDLLVYTSAPLVEDIEVMGSPAVHLMHSTDIPYADLWVRMSEVDIKNVSHNIVEQYVALDTEREEETVLMTLQDCAHVFKKGTRIRVIVAGGTFPLMARNPGYEGNRMLAKEMRAVTHTVRHQRGISKLVLPCST